ncbi:EamA family transporter [Bacillus sp. 1P10SD]|uniref:EamA family transporter n=1 Tax=Bacillus sp. 1P10SD TaxID=3132265 RepID=UPI0039A5E3E1
MTQKQANLILATVSMGWGTSYIFMKLCVDTISPLTIIALRFGIAFIVMMAIFYKKVILVDAITLKYSVIVGKYLTTWDLSTGICSIICNNRHVYF